MKKQSSEGEGCVKCGAEFDHENVVASSENETLVVFKCFECGHVEECGFPENQDRISANTVVAQEFC